MSENDRKAAVLEVLKAARAIAQEGEHHSGKAFDSLVKGIDFYDSNYRCPYVAELDPELRCELDVDHAGVVHRANGFAWTSRKTKKGWRS